MLPQSSVTVHSVPSPTPSQITDLSPQVHLPKKVDDILMGSQFVIQLVDDDERSGAAGGIYKTLGQSYSIRMSQQQILQNVNSSKQFKDLDKLVSSLL